MVVRLEVDAALPDGLAIYGARFGRYPIDPSVLFMLRDTTTTPSQAGVTLAPFGKLPAWRSVELFTLTAARAIEVRQLTYAAIITGLLPPAHPRHPAHIAPFNDSPPHYLQN